MSTDSSSALDMQGLSSAPCIIRFHSYVGPLRWTRGRLRELTCLILTNCLSYDHPIESNKGRTERGI